jgi:hypothetical protein
MRNTREALMSVDQDLLLYPLGTEAKPICAGCGKQMVIASLEAREGLIDFSTFRCDDCNRSETFACDKAE